MPFGQRPGGGYRGEAPSRADLRQWSWDAANTLKCWQLPDGLFSMPFGQRPGGGYRGEAPSRADLRQWSWDAANTLKCWQLPDGLFSMPFGQRPGGVAGVKRHRAPT